MQRAREFGFLTMVLLVVLRLAIGWHFLFEGLHKLDSFVTGDTATNKPFSSAGYFREAPGPFAWEMRQQLGDPDDEALSRLTVVPLAANEDPKSAKPYERTPPALKKDWDDYYTQFQKFYGLDEKQRDLAKGKLEGAESEVVHWLTLQAEKGKTKAEQQPDVLKAMTEVDKTYPSGVLTVDETPAQRVEDYRAKVQEYRDMLDKTDAAFGKDVVGAKRLAAKAEAATMRKSLMADLDKKTTDFKESLESVLTPEQRQKAMPSTPPLPALYWIDGITAWGLTIIGGCLLIGLLSRFNCILAAGFLLMTYLASPPFPWLPTPPNNEGNYLFVNKNLIEMFALLALAATASGRWFGVDALIHWIFVALFGRRKPQPVPLQRAA